MTTLAIRAVKFYSEIVCIVLAISAGVAETSSRCTPVKTAVAGRYGAPVACVLIRFISVVKALSASITAPISCMESLASLYRV